MTTRSPLTTAQSVTFYGIHEPEPGDQWRSLLTATSSAYRSWYLKDGDGARPSLETASRQLSRYLPELLPTWEKLTELADGDPTIARLLTLYRPPAFLPACSQAVSVGTWMKRRCWFGTTTTTPTSANGLSFPPHGPAGASWE